MNWSVFLGHFHPVMVHLPIGMLVVAFMLEVWAIRQKDKSLDKAIQFVLFWGCLSAILSALLGWWLSLPGGYNEHTLSLHQWAGITLAVLSALCWYLKKIAGSDSLFYRSALCTMILLLTITGHLGGTLTHGEGYLTSGVAGLFGSGQADNKTTHVPKKITDVNEALVYEDIVSPVLQAKCGSCHGEEKSKGKLRLDTYDLLMKGGEHGPVIIKNDAQGSELVKRLLLPVEDEHRMPPKGKEPLTADEISLVKWWINKGADMTKKVKDLNADEAAKQLIVRITGGTASEKSETNAAKGGSAGPTIFSKKVNSADSNDIKALKALSIMITPVAQGQNYLSVSSINYPGFNDDQVGLLSKISRQVTWLQLNNTKITDKALVSISKMPNLTKLNLAYTTVTDAGMRQICSLPQLEYLNLTGTVVTDKGLMDLAKLPAIKHIYCWKTQVTNAGVTAVVKTNPKIKVVTGDDIPQ